MDIQKGKIMPRYGRDDGPLHHHQWQESDRGCDFSRFQRGVSGPRGQIMPDDRWSLSLRKPFDGLA